MSQTGQSAWEDGPESSRGVTAAAALEGLPVAGAPRLDQVRLTGAVATTLRGAVDLLLGEEPPRRPLTVSWDDGALEVRCPAAQTGALTLAGGLMETIEGSLGPAVDGRQDWILRVPTHAVRPLYLMLQQGTLALAVPWHSVVRVRLATRQSTELLARREGCAVLPPFVSVPDETVERPAVLLGLGLKRAFLIADRLIWRLPADPIEMPETAPGLPLGHPVRASDGEVFWALDPAELLHTVEPQPRSKPGPAFIPPRPPAPTPAGPDPGSSSRMPLRLIELRPEDVEPLDGGAPDEEVAAPVMPAPPAPVTPRRPPVSARRALIAEDSIVGRIFLERLLAQRGFTVEAVSSARALEAALARGAWTLVLADVELPDSPRAEHLRRLATPGAPWVALVRDRDDAWLAAAAGIGHHLRKPFEDEHLGRLLLALGLAAEAP